MLVLEAINIKDLFDVVITVKDTISKADSEFYLLGAKKLNIHPFNCLVFDNSLDGITAAIEANMKYIGVGEALKYVGVREVI